MTHVNRRCGWMMTFSLLARTKQYARGKDKPSALITSAMQIVAERETPTRQWTRVLVPFRRPRSAPIAIHVSIRTQRPGKNRA